MITSRHRQLLKDAYQEIENQKHKTEKPMKEPHKLLQSILSTEIGVNLNENQALAVMEAVELVKSGKLSYKDRIRFGAKYNPDKCISIEYANEIVSNACSYLANHYNENSQPER